MSTRTNDPNHPTSPLRYMVIRTMNTYVYAVLICLLPLIVGARFIENERGVQALTTAVGLLVTFGLTYSTFWGTAERDRNLVMYGHLKENKWRGVQGALLGMLPLAFVTLLLILGIYFAFLPDWFNTLCRVLLLPFIFFMRAAADTPSAFSWALIFIVCWVPFAAWCGYYNGYHLIRLLDKLVYKQKPRSRDKRLR